MLHCDYWWTLLFLMNEEINCSNDPALCFICILWPMQINANLKKFLSSISTTLILLNQTHDMATVTVNMEINKCVSTKYIPSMEYCKWNIWATMAMNKIWTKNDIYMITWIKIFEFAYCSFNVESKYGSQMSEIQTCIIWDSCLLEQFLHWIIHQKSISNRNEAYHFKPLSELINPLLFLMQFENPIHVCVRCIKTICITNLKLTEEQVVKKWNRVNRFKKVFIFSVIQIFKVKNWLKWWL